MFFHLYCICLICFFTSFIKSSGPSTSISNKFHPFAIAISSINLASFSIESVFEKSDIALYVLSLSNEDCELIVDLNDIKIEDVLASLRLKSNFQICGGNESIAISNQLFKSERVKFLVVCDKSDVIGVIKKSHRRY